MAVKKRAEVITVLNGLKCILTPNEVLEQSNAFVFKDKKIFTFNGEIFASADYDIGIKQPFSIVGADFLKLLEKFPDDQIGIDLDGNELVLTGKRKKAGITIFKEILLPYTEVPEPGKLFKVSENFFHYLFQCAQICGRDHTNPKTTHVHVRKNFIEATDRYRVFRVDVTTKFIKREIMIPSDSILLLGNKTIKKAGIKDNWLHLLSENGIRYSLRCSEIEYFDDEMLHSILNIDGVSGSFPKTISDTIERAQVVQDQLGEAHITLKENALKIRTEKDGVWYEEKRSIKYSGKSISFTVSLNFLKEILSKTKKVIFGESSIKIEKDNFHFVICVEKK